MKAERLLKAERFLVERELRQNLYPPRQSLSPRGVRALRSPGRSMPASRKREHELHRAQRRSGGLQDAEEERCQ